MFVKVKFFFFSIFLILTCFNTHSVDTNEAEVSLDCEPSLADLELASVWTDAKTVKFSLNNVITTKVSDLTRVFEFFKSFKLFSPLSS